MTSKRLKPERPVMGCIYLLLASVALALIGAFAKLAERTVSPVMILFSQSFVTLVIVTPIIYLRSGWRGFRTRRIGTHLLRDLAGLLGLTCFVTALLFVPLTDAVLLLNTGPLFVPLIIWVWFRRTVASSLWWGILIGFLGVIVLLQPGKDLFQPALLLALAGGLMVALSFVAVRRLNKTENPYLILFYYVLVGSVVMLPFMIGLWRTPDLWTWVGLVIIGLLMMAYQLAIIQGFRFGKPSWLSAFIYFSVVWSALLDWLIWDHIPDALSIGGTVLVILGGVLVTLVGPERRRPTL